MEEIKNILKKRQPINLSIVIINIIVFLILDTRGGTENTMYMLEKGAAFGPAILSGEYWRLFTCMFLHFGIDHLSSNMLVLFFMGDMLEKNVGKVRYILIYVVGGLGGNLLSYALEMRSGDYSVSAGASGAIFAVVGALLYIVLVNKGRLEDLAGRRLFLMAGLTIFQGFTSVGIDNAAHIGGLICGLILTVILYRRPKEIQA